MAFHQKSCSSATLQVNAAAGVSRSSFSPPTVRCGRRNAQHLRSLDHLHRVQRGGRNHDRPWLSPNSKASSRQSGVSAGLEVALAWPGISRALSAGATRPLNQCRPRSTSASPAPLAADAAFRERHRQSALAAIVRAFHAAGLNQGPHGEVQSSSPSPNRSAAESRFSGRGSAAR